MDPLSHWRRWYCYRIASIHFWYPATNKLVELITRLTDITMFDVCFYKWTHMTTKLCCDPMRPRGHTILNFTFWSYARVIVGRGRKYAVLTVSLSWYNQFSAWLYYQKYAKHCIISIMKTRIQLITENIKLMTEVCRHTCQYHPSIPWKTESLRFKHCFVPLWL